MAGRPLVKPLEPPRPLKSTLKQSHEHPIIEVLTDLQKVSEKTENVANQLANGLNTEGMNSLTANLRLLGPQMEVVSKDILDRAFVIFRNASQDERLTILTRLNLLELIELRAKGWQTSEDINSYYKSKASHVEVSIVGCS